MTRSRAHRKARRGETGDDYKVEHEVPTETGVFGMLDRAAQKPSAAAVVVPEGDFEPNIPLGDEELAEGDSWEAPLPEPDPADVAAIEASALFSAEVTDEHLDTLWDWVRADEDKGQKFLGMQPRTSTDLRARVALFGKDFYALTEDTVDGQVHVGFAGFGPFGTDYAVMHLYLGPEFRNRVRGYMPQLLSMAAAEYPETAQFAVHTKDEALMRLYRPLGFDVQYLLTWRPPSVMITEE